MVYLVDSAVVLNNELFYFEEAKKYFTTYRVTLECRDFRSKMVVDNAIKSGFLTVIEPKDETIKEVEKLVKSIGARLSDTDISLVALALEFKRRNETVVVLTDDYGVQNILLKLQIRFQSVIRGEVKKFRKFR